MIDYGILSVYNFLLLHSLICCLGALKIFCCVPRIHLHARFTDLTSADGLQAKFSARFGKL